MTQERPRGSFKRQMELPSAPAQTRQRRGGNAREESNASQRAPEWTESTLGLGKTLPRTTPATPSMYKLDGGRLRAQDPRPVRVQLPCAPPVTPTSASMRRKGRGHGTPPTKGLMGGDEA